MHLSLHLLLAYNIQINMFYLRKRLSVLVNTCRPSCACSPRPYLMMVLTTEARIVHGSQVKPEPVLVIGKYKNISNIFILNILENTWAIHVAFYIYFIYTNTTLFWYKLNITNIIVDRYTNRYPTFSLKIAHIFFRIFLSDKNVKML